MVFGFGLLVLVSRGLMYKSFFDFFSLWKYALLHVSHCLGGDTYWFGQEMIPKVV